MKPDRNALVRVTIVVPVVLGDESANPAPEIPGVRSEQIAVSAGTAAIESRWDSTFAVPGTLDAAIRAEEAGAHAIVVDCMDDPGVEAVREVVRIPVVGPAEASMHLALTLADRFTVITTSSEDIPIAREVIERNGLERRCASVRAIGMPPLDLLRDPEETLARFTEQARTAVVADGAGAVIAGCTLFASLIPRAAAQLAEGGIDVPIINPLAAAIHHARTLARLGVSHGSLGYSVPASKPISWPDSSLRFEPTADEGSPR